MAQDIAIVGGGIAGLTLGLALHEQGIACRIFERATELRPIGVGINILPHAARVLHGLGLQAALTECAVLPERSAFFNRFGQLIYDEPLGRAAGYRWPQYSIHRGDLQAILADAFVARAGAAALLADLTCRGCETTTDGVLLHLAETSSGRPLEPVAAPALVACDGIGSVIRRQLHPDEGPPRYAGVMMWRGVTRTRPFLGGATMVRAGWLATGKMVIYPIRGAAAGPEQLVNWVAERAIPALCTERDWGRAGRLEDFLPAFADWRFEWLDVPALIKGADQALEFPMVDQEPLPFWSRGRVTLMGDAAHPMVPRGSNGAGQAILDAECLASLLARQSVEEAFRAYEAERLDATSRIVLTNRLAPPDIILKEVFERTGDRPFGAIEEVISRAELAAFQERYKQIAGYDLARLKAAADRP